MPCVKYQRLRYIKLSLVISTLSLAIERGKERARRLGEGIRFIGERLVVMIRMFYK